MIASPQKRQLIIIKDSVVRTIVDSNHISWLGIAVLKVYVNSIVAFASLDVFGFTGVPSGVCWFTNAFAISQVRWRLRVNSSLCDEEVCC